MPAFAIGVDLGGTNLRIAAVGEQGRVLEKVTTGTAVARGRDAVIAEMCVAIQEVAARHNAAAALAGIGVGIPGIIDLESGMLRESPNLPGWHDYPVRDEIERRLGSRVLLENDANCAAQGEFWMGAGRGSQDLCMITLGTGVGGGIVLQGRIWHGMTGMAGELGHITVVPDGAPCGCGNRGCVEQYASATAIQRMARERALADGSPELARLANDRAFSAQDVFALAQQGDRSAQEIFHQVGLMLGVVVAGLVNALNLSMYVIGGGVSGAWDAFAPSMFEEVRKRSFVYVATAPGTEAASRRRTHITRAQLGSDAGLIGAARVALLAEEHQIHQTARR